MQLIVNNEQQKVSNDPLERPSIRPHVCPSSIFFQFADDRRNLLDEEAASAATANNEQRTIAC